MATMNISLPDQMKEWVEEQVATGRYSNTSDYMRDLIRDDQNRIAWLQAEIDKGIASGISDRSPEELFAYVKQRTRAALKSRDAA